MELQIVVVVGALYLLLQLLEVLELRFLSGGQCLIIHGLPKILLSVIWQFQTVFSAEPYIVSKSWSIEYSRSITFTFDKVLERCFTELILTLIKVISEAFDTIIINKPDY